jgi:hypothetical protein
MLTTITTIIAEISVLIGIIVPMYKKMKKISEGTKCHLRQDLLDVYYHNKDDGKVRQYEYENFVMTYEAYKALGGNSFMDKIYAEVETFEIIT